MRGRRRRDVRRVKGGGAGAAAGGHVRGVGCASKFKPTFGVETNDVGGPCFAAPQKDLAPPFHKPLAFSVASKMRVSNACESATSCTRHAVNHSKFIAIACLNACRVVACSINIVKLC